MKQESVQKIIETLKQSGSDTIELYADKAITNGITEIGFSLIFAAFIIISLQKLKRVMRDTEDFLLFAVMVVIVFGWVPFVFVFMGITNILHPEATAISNLLNDITGNGGL